MLNIKQTADFLRERDRFLIISHRRPDGDALCSSSALCRGLRDCGKTAYTLRNPQTTDKYLPFIEDYHAPEGYTPDVVISTDLADLSIIQNNALHLADRIDLAIDHHRSNTGFCPNRLVLPGFSSCGEVVFLVLKKMGAPMSHETANLLYIALTTDTGCFRYKNVNAHSLRAGAELIKAGADNGAITHMFFMTKRRSRLLLEGMLINSLEFYKEGELAIAPVTLEMMSKAGVTEEDMEDIAVIAGQIEGTEASITIRELEEGGCKVSVRTVNYANADAMCRPLGGGGHNLAAGCTLDCDIAEAKKLMLEAAEKVWKIE